MAAFQNARPGDRVTIRTPHGSTRTGRVVMCFPHHLVLNGGGKHGTPLVADASNFVSIRPVPAQQRRASFDRMVDMTLSAQ